MTVIFIGSLLYWSLLEYYEYIIKAEVIVASTDATIGVIMSVYPSHKLVADKYIERGDG